MRRSANKTCLNVDQAIDHLVTMAEATMVETDREVVTQEGGVASEEEA